MIPMKKKLNRCLLNSVLLVLLTSCSAIQVSYRFLDDLMRWELNKYVSVQGQLSSDLNLALKAFHDWHRADQLPLYETFLTGQIKVLERDKIDATQLQRAYDRGMQFWQLSMRRLAPDLASTLSQLDDKQLAQLAKNMDKKNAEYEEEKLAPPNDKRREERIERMQDTLKKWVGTLTTEQEQRVAQWADKLSYETAARLQQRRLMRERFDQILTTRTQPQRMQQQLTQLIATPQQQWTPAYRQYSMFNRRVTYQLLIDLHASLTAAQKKKLLDKLDGYKRDFVKLSG